MFSQQNLSKAPKLAPSVRAICSKALESLVRSLLYYLGDLQDAALSFSPVRQLVLSALQNSCFKALCSHVTSTSQNMLGFEDVSYYVDPDSKKLLLHAVYHSLAGKHLASANRKLASVGRILVHCNCQSSGKMQTRLVMAAAREVQAHVVMVDANVLEKISQIAFGRKLPGGDGSGGGSCTGLLAGGLSWFVSGGSAVFVWEVVQEFCRSFPDRVILFVKDAEQTMGGSEKALRAFQTAFQTSWGGGGGGASVGIEEETFPVTVIAGTSLRESGSNRIGTSRNIRRGEESSSSPAGAEDEPTNLFDFSFDLPREENILNNSWESIFHVQVRIQPPPEGQRAVQHCRQLFEDAQEEQRDRNYLLAVQAGDLAGLLLPDKHSIVYKHRDLTLWEWCKVITWSNHQQLYLSSIRKSGHSIGSSDLWLVKPGTRNAVSLPANFCVEDEGQGSYSDIFAAPETGLSRSRSVCKSGGFSIEELETVKQRLRRPVMELEGELRSVDPATLFNILHPIFSLLLLGPKLLMYFISILFSFFCSKVEESSIPLNSSLTFMNPVFAEDKYCEGVHETNTLLCEESILYGLKMLDRSKGQQPNVRPENSYERQLLVDVLNPNDLGTGFSSVGALSRAKDALREAVQLPFQHPELFGKSSLIQPSKGVLLFGPPGTGKTMLARAAAAECSASFLAVHPSTVLSKWVGDGVKNVRAVFSLATKLSPCVVFVDEVDALLGQRSACEEESMRELKNEFMAQWDGIRSGAPGVAARVMVLGATNRPQDIDEAVLRRFSKRIFCDLPSEQDLIAILKVMLAGENLDSSVDVEAIAKLAKGYSGSDLKQVCTAAAMRPVKEYLTTLNQGKNNSSQEPPEADFQEQGACDHWQKDVQAFDWDQGLHSFSIFENEPEIDLIKRSILEDHDDIIASAKSGFGGPRCLQMADFEFACREIAPSVESSGTNMQALWDWNQKWGDGGKRQNHNSKLSYFI